MSEIEERKKKLSLAVRKLRDSEQQLCNLQAKKSELSYSNNDSGGIDAAINHRREVMALLVTGRASQAQLDEATKALEELEKAAKLSDEMAEAITVAIQAAEKNISQLKTGVNAARRRLLESIYDTLRTEIQDTVRDKVNCAIAVRTRIGITPADTLVNLFSDSGRISVIDTAAKAVEAEYGIEF